MQLKIFNFGYSTFMFQVSKHLNQVARQVMKTVSVVMLLQCTAPSFITTLDGKIVRDELAYTSHHDSLPFPQLFKEKEEDLGAFNTIVSDINFVELLDLSAHASNLNEVHNGFEFSVSRLRYSTLRSQLFTLHRSFLI